MRVIRHARVIIIIHKLKMLDRMPGIPGLFATREVAKCDNISIFVCQCAEHEQQVKKVLMRVIRHAKMIIIINELKSLDHIPDFFSRTMNAVIDRKQSKHIMPAVFIIHGISIKK